MEVMNYLDGVVHLVLDLRIYRLEAIKKTAYRLAAKCTAVLGELEGEQVRAELRFRPGVTQVAAEEVARQFFQELLDQELREHVAGETEGLRTLILAQAFSKADLIKRE